MAALVPLDPATFLTHGSWDRPALTTILGAAADLFAAGKQARQRIAVLAEPDGVAIVTGQQPAVGGGPLYSLVKTAHAIALARMSGSTAVPVFWCASEDHDLGEAGHADFISRDGRIHRFTGDLGGGRASLRHRPASAWWPALVAHARTHLGEGLGAAWLAQHRPHDGEGMGAWMCRLFTALFGAYGLVCVEGHLLRPLWTAAMARALDAWPAQGLEEVRRRLLAEGCDDAFGPLAQPPLFADRTDGRVALAPTHARALLQEDAGSLSPGAALRPVLQQAALPAIAYVGGPGELAYHRFITPLYGTLAVPEPTLIPRCSLSLVPSWVQRGCARWQVSPEAVSGPAPDIPSMTAGTTLARLDEALADLGARPLPAGHECRMKAGLARLSRERDRLAASLARADRQAAGRPAWGALQGWLHPRGGRQERTLSLFQAVWQFGPGIADRLVDAASLTAPAVHGWVELR
jgi:bacillithiol synthase